MVADHAAVQWHGVAPNIEVVCCDWGSSGIGLSWRGLIPYDTIVRERSSGM